MAANRSRLRILLWLALIAFVLAVGLFIYSYIIAKNRVLSRAESFRFRRMQVTQLEEEGSFRFFYITNRNLLDEAGELKSRFGNAPGAELNFGRFDTTIKPSLGIGMLINPTDWLQNEEIRIEAVKRLEQAQFVEQLRAQVDASPQRSILVVIHGYRETFPGALRKTAFVGHVLDIDTPVVVFDWPGDQGSGLRGYRRAAAVARDSGATLARALQVLVDEIGADRVWVLANSLGAQVVADGFSVLYAMGEWADPDKEIHHVVLTAPDVSHEEFDARFRDEIAALSERLTVYVSSNDRALMASRIINRGRRRGQSTLTGLDPDQLQEALQIADLVEPGSDLVTLIDATPINRTRNFHNFSLETPEFFDDLFLRLSNEAPPRTRVIYPIRGPDGSIYWVLTRSR
jgi:esterase/lipase superfamily enzyme